MALSIAAPQNNDQIAMNALLEVIYQRYGYDFRHYVKASILRRLQWRALQWQLPHVADLVPLALHSEQHFNTLLTDMAISVTSMYRDPPFFQALIKHVFPVLKTFPFFKIWHAGCASGEEVYSLAILLQEHGLYDRAQIYATDFNNKVLQVAKRGIYDADIIAAYRPLYQQAGGQRSLMDYFHTAYSNAIVRPELKRRVTFAQHNLVTDGVFGEMELIICRNVMIYFDAELKQRVFTLFSDSLHHSGFLCLGSQESMTECSGYNLFKSLETKGKIFKKIHLGQHPARERPQTLRRQTLNTNDKLGTYE